MAVLLTGLIWALTVFICRGRLCARLDWVFRTFQKENVIARALYIDFKIATKLLGVLRRSLCENYLNRSENCAVICAKIVRIEVNTAANLDSGKGIL